MKKVKKRKSKEFHRNQNQFDKNRKYIEYKKNKRRKLKAEHQSNQFQKGKIAFFVLCAFVLTTMIFWWKSSLNDLKPDAIEAKIIANHEISANKSDSFKSEDASLKPDYIRTYDFWIQGIGNEFMWNNESGSTCLFEPTDLLVDEMIAYQHGNVLETRHDTDKKAFSAIMDRMIIVQCSSQWKYFQSPMVRFERDKIMDESQTKWMSVSIWNNQNILYLDELTQSTWLKCGNQTDFHFSLLPLSTLDPSLYQEKKELIEQNFGQQRLPNMVMFIMDSTSRSGFHRGCQDTMNLLSQMKMDRNGQTKSEIFEFHRYSTVSFATGQNMAGLLTGNCASFVDECPDKQHNMTLFEYYDAMGFNVFGWSKDIKNDHLWHWDINDGDSVIGVQFIKKALAQQHADRGVPYFIIIHELSNHVSNSQGIYATDELIHGLLETINYDNTMLHLLADHGNLIGNGAETLYGRWEMNNPINILLMPKWFANDIDTTTLKINEQRFLSHYDNHRFYKEFLWKLHTQNDNLTLYDVMIEQTLPVIGDMSLSMDILNEVIPVDRSCDGILPGHCVCDTNALQKMELTEALIKKDDGKCLQRMIDAINEVTGDGKWDCRKLNVADFTVVKHFEGMVDDGHGSMKLTIQQIISEKEEREMLKRENRLLTYSADFNYNARRKTKTYKLTKIKDRGYSIERIDWLKFEECTELYGDGNKMKKHITTFVNKTVQKEMEESGEEYNLRLCNCK